MNRRKRRRNRTKTRDPPKKRVKFMSAPSMPDADKFGMLTSDSDRTLAKSMSSLSIKQQQARKRKARSYSAWENIVLHYLSKLKNLWRSPSDITTSTILPADEKRGVLKKKGRSEKRAVKKSTANNHHQKLTEKIEKVEAKPSEATSEALPSLDTACSTVASSVSSVASVPADSHEKTYNIISNAVKYGLRRNVLQKGGKYFWFKKTAAKSPYKHDPEPKKCALKTKHLYSGRDFAKKQPRKRNPSPVPSGDRTEAFGENGRCISPFRGMRSPNFATRKTTNELLCECKKCRHYPPF